LPKYPSFFHKERFVMKKIMPLLSIVLIAAFLLAACTTPAAAPTATSAPAPTTAAPVKITIWHQWDGAYLDAITAVFKDYQTQHPNVTIDLTKPDNVSDALKVAIPAGEGPDIIGWANDQIGTNGLNGNIVDLDSLGMTQDYLKQNYEPAAVQGVIWQNKIWALPESQEGIALVYNKALMTADFMPKGGNDFEDLLAKAKAFAAANAGKFLFCNQGFAGGDAYHIAPVYFGFGIPTYVDDQGKVYLNTPEAIKAAEWLVTIKPFLAAEQTAELCKTSFIEGKVAAMWTGPWNIADFDKAKIDYGFISMGKPFVGIKTLMITKNAVDRGTAKVALDIIEFYTNADNSKKVALANKTIPANTAALKSAEVQALASIAGFGGATNSGVPMANTPYAGAQWGPVGDATAAVWSGSQTPADAMAAAQAAIEKAIAAMK
jgi:arabinogalactan oligomer/maltooligosaccharide transport system substrate-binding protein